METYDYIVVGGGSSGCIVAAELAKDPATSVLVLEWGPAAEEHPETLHADGYKDAFANDEVIVERFASPQAHCNQKRIFMGTGRVLGGSGSVNGMVYTRGDAKDYAEWPGGWHWPDVRPDFEAIEAELRPHRRTPTKFNEAFLKSAQGVGFAAKEDLNDGDLSNVMGYQWMNYEGDRRRSSYVAFLKERLQQPNLTVIANARVERLTFNPDGRVNGVEGRLGNAPGRPPSLPTQWHARKEVVMCAGALETPKLLMLSGLGPGAELRRHGISVRKDLPAVGEGLHDHPNVPLFHLAKHEPDSNYPQMYGFYRANVASNLPKGQSDCCFVAYPARSSLEQATSRILPGFVLPQGAYDDQKRGWVRRAAQLGFGVPGVRPWVNRMWAVVVILGKPKSRGRLRLASHRVEEQAELDPAYYAHPEDMDTMCKAVRLAQAMTTQAPLAQLGNRPLGPTSRTLSDRELAHWIRNNTITTYHFAGTCSMGEHGSSACDNRLRLRGVPGLRIADASAIPSTPVSALNAPSMLVGYRAARFLREEATV